MTTLLSTDWSLETVRRQQVQRQQTITQEVPINSENLLTIACKIRWFSSEETLKLNQLEIPGCNKSFRWEFLPGLYLSYKIIVFSKNSFPCLIDLIVYLMMCFIGFSVGNIIELL